MDGVQSNQLTDNTVVAALGDDSQMLDSVFHRGNFMEASKPGTQKIKNLDVIQEMQLPASWGRFEQSSTLGYSTVFAPKDESTQIVFAGRHEEVGPKSAAAFESLVQAKLPTPRVVYADDLGATPQSVELFKSLADALGSRLVGDNQLSIRSTGPDARRPAFHIDRARVVTINGKNALAVDGWFTQLDDHAEIKMGPDGPVKRYYSGVFFDAEGKGNQPGSKIDELYLMADNQASFVKNKDTFSSATKSIKWR